MRNTSDGASLGALNLVSGWQTGPADFWALDNTGTALAHFDAGRWRIGRKTSLTAVWGSVRDDVWTVGGGGAIGTKMDLLDIGGADGVVWVVGKDGLLLQRTIRTEAPSKGAERR